MESTDNEHQSTDYEQTDNHPEPPSHGLEWSSGAGDTFHNHDAQFEPWDDDWKSPNFEDAIEPAAEFENP
eukprot:16216563-Heterocapsa_arctica.AAC.1